jgi:hypothetical protein
MEFDELTLEQFTTMAQMQEASLENCTMNFASLYGRWLESGWKDPRLWLAARDPGRKQPSVQELQRLLNGRPGATRHISTIAKHALFFEQQPAGFDPVHVPFGDGVPVGVTLGFDPGSDCRTFQLLTREKWVEVCGSEQAAVERAFRDRDASLPDNILRPRPANRRERQVRACRRAAAEAAVGCRARARRELPAVPLLAVPLLRVGGRSTVPLPCHGSKKAPPCAQAGIVPSPPAFAHDKDLHVVSSVLNKQASCCCSQ